MKDEIKEILDYFQKDVDKYEESKKYLMQKYGYDEETIDNISQHERHINTKKLLDYITNLQDLLNKTNDELVSYVDRCIELEEENEKALEINQKLQNMGILNSRAILWLGQQEKLLKGEDKNVNITN